MPRKNTEDISKLPLWAQQKINTLEVNLEYYKRQIQEMLGDETMSNVSIDRSLDRKFLPKNSRVSFYFGGNIIDVYHENGKLGIHGSGSGTGSLILRPYSGNVIHASIER